MPLVRLLGLFRVSLLVLLLALGAQLALFEVIEEQNARHGLWTVRLPTPASLLGLFAAGVALTWSSAAVAGVVAGMLGPVGEAVAFPLQAALQASRCGRVNCRALDLIDGRC